MELDSTHDLGEFRTGLRRILGFEIDDGGRSDLGGTTGSHCWLGGLRRTLEWGSSPGSSQNGLQGTLLRRFSLWYELQSLQLRQKRFVSSFTMTNNMSSVLLLFLRDSDEALSQRGFVVLKVEGGSSSPFLRLRNLRYSPVASSCIYRFSQNKHNFFVTTSRSADSSSFSGTLLLVRRSWIILLKASSDLYVLAADRLIHL